MSKLTISPKVPQRPEKDDVWIEKLPDCSCRWVYNGFCWVHVDDTFPIPQPAAPFVPRKTQQ